MVVIWKPGDCYTMTVPLHTAGLLLPKCRVGAGLGAGRQPDWILDRISGKKVVEACEIEFEQPLPQRAGVLNSRAFDTITGGGELSPEGTMNLGESMA